MLETFLIIAAVIVTLVILLVLWPLRLRIMASPEATWIEARYFLMRVRFNPLTGMQTVHIAGVKVISGKARLPLPTLKEAGPKKPGTETAQPPGYARVRVLWEHRPLLRRVLLKFVRMIGRLLRSWTLVHARVALVLGLGDPAQTGIAAGCLYAALPTVQMAMPRWQLVFVPEFSGARVAADVDIALRLIPLEPLYHIARTLGTLPWRGLWKLRAALSQS